MYICTMLVVNIIIFSPFTQICDSFPYLMLEITVGCDGRTVVGRHEPAHLPPPPHHPAPRPPGPGHSALLLEVLLIKVHKL